MKVAVNIENCTRHAEDFGRKLCENLGWDIARIGHKDCVVLDEVHIYPIADIAFNFNVINRAELEVIKRVGLGFYGQTLTHVVNVPIVGLVIERTALIATATTQQRLCALLLALGIEEVEAGE